MNDEDLLEYIPELDDNRELEPEAQVVCQLLPMTAEELRAYQRVMVGVKPGSSQAYKKAENVIKRIISDRVVSISNYEDVKGKPCTTGEELHARGEPALLDELYDALQSKSKLKEGRRKN